MDTVRAENSSDAQSAILRELEERLRSFTGSVSRRSTVAESGLKRLEPLDEHNSELRSSGMNYLNTSLLPGLKDDLEGYQRRHTELLADCHPWRTFLGEFINNAREALETLDENVKAIIERRALLVTALKDSPVR